jgi:endonuclease YncB( thermonuclease family)
MANIMESTLQKTFTQLGTQLSVAAVLVFILMLYPTLSVPCPSKVIHLADSDTIKILNNDKTGIIRLVGIEAPETSKKKNEPGQRLSQKSTKHRSSLVFNNSDEIKSCVNDRYC